MEVQEHDSLSNLRKNIDDMMQNQLKSSLIEYIFQSEQTLKNIEKQYSLLPKGLCAKSIENQQPSYKCYDCGRDNQYHIYCQQCFLNGYHEGHRYKRSLQRTGCCDCGDQNAIISQGFCKMHLGFKSLKVPPVDEHIRDRLETALQILFQKLFNLCQRCNYKGIKKFENVQKIPKETQKIIDEYKIQIRVILDIISQFISDFCKDKIPILYEIGKIFNKKKQHVRHHVCKQKNLTDSFKGQYEQNEHICISSIVQDIYLYSLFLQGQKQLMTKFLFALFISPEFKKKLVESYVQKYTFLIEFKLDPSEGEIFKSELHSIYTQFFSKQLVLHWTQSEHFNQIFKIMENVLDLLLTDKFKIGYQGLLALLNVIFFLQNRFEENKLNIENFKIINQLLRISFKSIPIPFISCEQQKIRIYCDYLIILAVVQLIKSFDFTDIHVKQYLKTLILQYYQSATQRTQTTNQYCQKNPSFNWFSLSEKIFGIILTVYFVQYGEEQTRKLVQTYLNDQLEDIIKRLLLIFTFQKRIQQLNLPHYSMQETPKDILKLFYRCSNFYLHDSDLLCLQMLAILMKPDEFIELLMHTKTKNINQKYGNQILLELILQESFFLNISSICEIKSKLYNESLKSYLITAFNYKRKMTVHDLNTLFQKMILTKKTKYEKVLPQICKFDKQSRAFFLNSEHHGLSQNFYFHRNKELRQKIYDNTHTLNFNVFIKDNLVQKLADNKTETFCTIVSNNLSRSNKLQFILFNSFRMLWDKQVLSNFELTQLKIISVFFIRNKNNEEYKNIIKQLKSELVDKKSGTQIQKILQNIFKKYAEIQQNKMQIEKQLPNSKDTKKAHSIKILEQMKKKQKKFIQNNEIIIQKKQSVVEAKQNCLICFESFNDQHISVIPITKIKVEQYNNNIFECFNTCNHKYHSICLSKKTVLFCPLCALYFNTLLPQIDRLFEFYRLDKIIPKISLNTNNIAADKKQVVEAIDRFGVHYIGQQNMQDFTKLNIYIFQMIQSRICLSIQDSIEIFFLRFQIALRSAYGVLIFLGGASALEQLNLDDQKLIIKILNNKIEFYCKFIKHLLLIPLYKDSKETINEYKKIIKRVYNIFLAANMVSHYSGQKLQVGEIMSLFTIKKEIFEAYMRQFFKGILFTYSIIFDDDNINIFRKVQRDQNIPTFTLLSSSFFEIDHQVILQSYMIAKESGINVMFSQQSLIKQIQIIQLPHTYKEFHHQYYAKKCFQCDKFATIKQQKQYICLLCGIKLCSRRCGSMIQDQKQKNCINHAKQQHCSFSVYIDLDEGEMALCQNEFAIPYGHLYENEFGDFNNEIEKNWENLVKNYNKIQKVLSLMQKHQMQMQIFSKLKSHTKHIII